MDVVGNMLGKKRTAHEKKESRRKEAKEHVNKFLYGEEEEYEKD